MHHATANVDVHGGYGLSHALGYLTFAKSFDRGADWFAQVESDVEAIEREVGAKLLRENSGDKFYLSVPTAVLGIFNAPADREHARTTWRK